MLKKAMEFFGFTQEFEGPGLFCEGYHGRALHDFREAIKTGDGIVGSGKTMLAHQAWEELMREGEMLLPTGLAVEKDRVTLDSLMIDLLAHLTTDEKFKIPRSGKDREGKLREIIRERGRPVALFVDEAHDLQIKTLIESAERIVSA